MRRAITLIVSIEGDTFESVLEGATIFLRDFVGDKLSLESGPVTCHHATGSIRIIIRRNAMPTLIDLATDAVAKIGTFRSLKTTADASATQAAADQATEASLLQPVEDALIALEDAAKASDPATTPPPVTPPPSLVDLATDAVTKLGAFQGAKATADASTAQAAADQASETKGLADAEDALNALVAAAKASDPAPAPTP